jgi:hypothetical protein
MFDKHIVFSLDCNFIMIKKYMHPLNYIFAYHIDSTTFTDGDYELIPDQGMEISEDPGNVIENLTESPNQSSENFDTPAPNPTQEGKPRT